MLNIIIDNYIPYLDNAFDGVANVQFLDAKDMTNENIKNADALIVRTRTKCNEEILKNTHIKFIASATIGYDHIDGRYCDQNDIKWTNAPGCNSLAVAQYIASVFSFLKKDKGFDPTGKTLGIVGVGSVGTEIEKLAHAFGIKVLLNDPPRARREGNTNFHTLDEVCEQSDIITFHTWLDTDTEDKTYHLANDFFFKKLKRQPYIINAARGEVVDTKALKKAIRTHQITGAIIDCWENEPDIDKELLDLCLIATPHIAGYSADGKANAAMQSVRAISRFFELGIDKWQAQELNLHFSTQKYADFYDFFLDTYPIKTDSEKLKKNPEKFEYQRSNYDFRREPKAYWNFMPKELCRNFWSDFAFFRES